MLIDNFVYQSIYFEDLDVKGLQSFTSLDEFDHDCDKYLSIRERLVGAGSAYVNQCVKCGRQVGKSIPKKSILSSPEPFDKELVERYDFHYSRVVNTLNTSLSDSGVKPYTNVYEAFEKEMDLFISDFVIRNNNGKEKAKNSLINSYITRKSDQYHKATPSIWKDEPQLKSWFVNTFSKWFDIYPEVRGNGYINGKENKIIIDFVIIAKQQILNEGFTSDPIGVEVKYIKTNTGQGFTKSASNGVFQALSYAYSNSTWDIPSRPNSRLASVLMFSNLSHKSERDFLQDAPGRFTNIQWGSFLNLARHANVGEFHCYRHTVSNEDMWSLKFSGGTYFTYHGGEKYQLRDTNLIGKEKIGNIQ